VYWPKIKNRLSQAEKDLHEAKGKEKCRRLGIIRDHLECLVNFIENEFADFLEVAEGVDARTLRAIAFEDLWYLFKPGEVITSHVKGYKQAYVLYSVSGGRLRMSDAESRSALETVYDAFRGRRYSGPEMSDNGYHERDTILRRPRESYIPRRSLTSDGISDYSPLTLDCFFLDFNGVFIAPLQKTLQIPHYSGVKEISDLNIRPIAFDHQMAIGLGQLRERGARYISLRGHKLLIEPYEGVVREVYIDPETGYSVSGGWRRYNRNVLGRLDRTCPDPAEFTFPRGRTKRRIDEERYVRVRSRSGIRSEVDDDVEAERMEEFLRNYSALLSPVNPSEEDLSAEQLQLLPPEILGYVFQSRSWRKWLSQASIGVPSKRANVFCKTSWMLAK
jgi:hypothetical protein